MLIVKPRLHHRNRLHRQLLTYSGAMGVHSERPLLGLPSELPLETCNALREKVLKLKKNTMILLARTRRGIVVSYT